MCIKYSAPLFVDYNFVRTIFGVIHPYFPRMCFADMHLFIPFLQSSGDDNGTSRTWDVLSAETDPADCIRVVKIIFLIAVSKIFPGAGQNTEFIFFPSILCSPLMPWQSSYYPRMSQNSTGFTRPLTGRIYVADRMLLSQAPLCRNYNGA